MFVLEIDFNDGSNDVECLIVRRPKFLVGSSSNANVIIEEMKSLGYDLKFLKGIGRNFRCLPQLQSGQIPPHTLKNEYKSDGMFQLGPISMRVSSIDSDLAVRESDPPDKSGVRILRQVSAFETPRLPAVVVLDGDPFAVSFGVDQTLTVGRSNKCSIRVDSPDVSSEHARIGFESGKFWIEDLGSTNGIFVDRQQISGRHTVQPGERITLGGQTVVVGATSQEQYFSILKSPGHQEKSVVAAQKSTYPALVSTSELVRPNKFILQPGSNILIGRDPESDIWIGAPHISRKHCSINVTKTGQIAIVDLSRNGINWNGGIIPKSQPFVVEAGRQGFDLGGGVNIAVCFSERDEEDYRMNRGTFLYSTQARGTELDTSHVRNLAGPSNLHPSKSLTSVEAVSDKAGLFTQIVSRVQTLSFRDKAILVLFLLSLTVIVTVIVSLLLNGFR